jgi:hypothetical protein
MGQGPVGFYGKEQGRASGHEHFCQISGFGHPVIGMIQPHIPITMVAAFINPVSHSIIYSGKIGSVKKGIRRNPGLDQSPRVSASHIKPSRETLLLLIRRYKGQSPLAFD